MTAVRITTFDHRTPLTGATGFFFGRDERLFLVTSRHVLIDEAAGHHPDRIEIELHSDAANLAASTGFSIPLYSGGTGVWRQSSDPGGQVDVVAVPIDRSALPAGTALRAFGPDNLPERYDAIEVGTDLLVVGFPLGFHDTLHHMPVVRRAAVASSFGLRFQGQGYFLTDARTHRGTSGAPVVMRTAGEDMPDGPLPWNLLGIHSGRLDMGNRDEAQDEALGLNSAWYADVLLTLTGP